MRNTNHIQLIVCDIDGTILPSGKTSISSRLKNAFQRVQEKGMEVFIDTGRHFTFLPDSLFEDLPMQHIGTVNGAVVNDRNGEILFEKAMDETTMWAMVSFAEKHHLGLGFKFKDSVVTYVNEEKFLDGYCENEEARKKVKIDSFQTHHKYFGTPVGAFMIGRCEEIEPYKQELSQCNFAFSTKRGYDVFLKGIDKTLAVEFLLKEKQFSWDNVIAFGDAGNDTALIQKAAIGVSLGNGKDDIKEYADLICDTCENDGVAKVLEEYFL